MNAAEESLRRRLQRHARAPLLAALAGCAALAASAPAAAEATLSTVVDRCGQLSNHFGPFDYRIHRNGELRIVEQYHFTPGVESLTQPATTTFANMAQDVAYTLHTSPNHHRALLAMMRLGERHKTDQPPGAKYTIECYFIRGMRFAPDDSVVKGLYAHYLIKQNRKDDALRQLELAASQAGDNPLSHYNIGLLYFDLGRYDRSLAEEHKARSLGLNRTELAEMLKRVGKWQEPAAATAPAAPASAARAMPASAAQ